VAEAAGYLIEALAKAVDDARKRSPSPSQAPSLPARAPMPAKPVASRGDTARRGDTAARDAREVSAPAEPPRPFGLLSAFRVGENLLSGFILAEALSPPIALRTETTKPR
jgi:hypothetical protein